MALRAATVALASTMVIAASRPAHADAWTPTTFVGPTGATAHGLATPAAGDPGVRLLVGCESGKDSWRGIALLETAPTAPTPGDRSARTEVSTAFFGRAAVTSAWPSKVTSDGVLSWDEASDELRRGMLREDQTRGQATLHVVLRRGETTRELAFGVDGLGARSPELAAQCDGWGAGGTSKRRERGW
ncbi:hypothetical protein K2Z84_03860 [Candidatus Binatia bacterium]|nr:hypothetical protein [Candidatus Binatia bacterium]